MKSRNFLTSHARVLLRIAREPGVRLRDIAASLGSTERSVPATTDRDGQFVII
jgi:hypothetical protein